MVRFAVTFVIAALSTAGTLLTAFGENRWQTANPSSKLTFGVDAVSSAAR